MYRVVFTTKASREYKKLPETVVVFIDHAINQLLYDPYSRLLDIKKLLPPQIGFRLRIRAWRIIYTIEEGQKIKIRSIKDRKDAYK